MIDLSKDQGYALRSHRYDFARGKGCLLRLSIVAFIAMMVLTAASSAYASDPAPTPVTTRGLDTGPTSELVSSVPIASGEPSPTSIYSLKVPSIEEGEVLRTAGNVELASSRPYDATVSVRLVLTESSTATSGITITPWAAVTQGKGSRVTLPVNGSYRASSTDVGTRYLKLQVKVSSPEAKSGDTLTVASNSGRLGVARYAPTPGPTSIPTDELQPIIGEVSQLITSLPVDSGWRVVLSRKLSDLSEEDLLEVATQIGVENPSGGAVKLEAKISRTTSATYNGGSAALWPVVKRLTPGTKFTRVVSAGEIGPITDSGSKYVNLSLRAIPIEGTPAPLSIVAGSGAFSALRFKPNPGSSGNPLLEGTDERSPYWATGPAVSTVPFAAEGKEPLVVKSLPIWSLRKGDVIRARGLVTASLAGGESAPVETALIVADSETATTGETIAARNGDILPTAAQEGSSFTEGIYVAPKTAAEVKRLNLVVYANRAPAKAGEALSIAGTALNYARSQPVGQFSADFENGLLDQFYQNGKTLSVTSNQAREGTHSLQVDVNSESWCPCDLGQDPNKEIRRAEISPPDTQSAGGRYGEDRWYGFSVYFPEGFQIPKAEGTSKAGTWNIFAQWHAQFNDGLDCLQEAGEVPISFTARHWKAGGHTNPGETQTATPTDGDYIEVKFQGGELLDSEGKACAKTARPEERFVIAHLERGRWYDLVLHSRWTTEVGGPGNSISDVWLDGKEVLGDSTNPVAQPTMLWHGSSAVHNNVVGFQTGFYRGPSKEDPTTRLFLDAYRTGNSYAQVAPEVHAPRIDAESYSMSIQGAGLKTFQTSKGKFNCGEAVLQGSTANATSQIDLSAEYNSCTATASNFFSTVAMNSCRYVLNVQNAGPPYTGIWGITCQQTEDGIEYRAFQKQGGALLCSAKVGPQAGLEGVALSNTGEGSKRAVRLAAELKGVKYEYNGGSVCTAPETRIDGVMTGETTFSGLNSKAEEVGVYLTGYKIDP